MKTDILDISGKKIKILEVPRFFSEKPRLDFISTVLYVKKTKQPYGPSLVAGKQYSASGRIVHRRHVWMSGYGRGTSRIPRKIMSQVGSQYQGVGAEIASTVGGRRAHPPKPFSMINTKKLNKKILKNALISALSSTANERLITKKYSKLSKEKITNLPIVVESKITSLKTKDFLKSLKAILGEKILEVSIPIKKVRSGKGKRRGRMYKENAGAILVVGNDETVKSSVLETKKANNVSVIDLAKGGPGRIAIYTEKAINDLQKRLEGEIKK